jgi:hypothetical protein
MSASSSARIPTAVRQKRPKRRVEPATSKKRVVEPGRLFLAQTYNQKNRDLAMKITFSADVDPFAAQSQGDIWG